MAKPTMGTWWVATTGWTSTCARLFARPGTVISSGECPNVTFGVAPSSTWESLMKSLTWWRKKLWLRTNRLENKRVVEVCRTKEIGRLLEVSVCVEWLMDFNKYFPGNFAGGRPNKPPGQTKLFQKNKAPKPS